MQDQDYLWELNEDDFWHKNKDRVLLKLIKKGTVLDVGAGTGSFSIKLNKMGFDVTYIDTSKKYFEIAKQRAGGSKIKFICGDFLKYHFKNKFDNIVISGFIEHIEDDVNLLDGIYKLLNPGGRVILLTSAYPSLYSNFDKSVGHYRRYTKKELKSKVESVGFKIKFHRYWDVLGIPVLIVTKLTGKVPVTIIKLNNKFLNFLLDKWFFIVENRCCWPVGLDLILMAER